MKARTLLTGLTLAALPALLGPAPATAQTCFSASQIPVGFNFFEVEGPLTDYTLSPTERSLSLLGGKVHVPAGVPFDVGAGPTRTFEEIVDAAAEAERPILGDALRDRLPATVIAVGTLENDAAGCARMVAAEVEFLFGEHVTVGPLTDVDLASGSFAVNGLGVRMSTDPRVPSILLDASGNEDLTLKDLASAEFIGTTAGGDGFMEDGILWGNIIETSAFRRRADGRDNVIIEVARWGADEGELRAVGFVSLDGTTQTAATHVDIHVGSGGNAVENPSPDGLTCTGTRLARAPLVGDPESPGIKEFTFRREDVSEPENICVRTVRQVGSSFTNHPTSASNSRGVSNR